MKINVKIGVLPRNKRFKLFVGYSVFMGKINNIDEHITRPLGFKKPKVSFCGKFKGLGEFKREDQIDRFDTEYKKKK